MDFCPLQVILLALDLGKACVGMQIQKFSILPQEPRDPPLSHPSPACVLSHFPYWNHLLGHSLSSQVFFSFFPWGVVDRGKEYVEFSSKKCLYFSTLSSVNLSCPIEPKTKRVVTFVTQLNCKTFSVFTSFTSKIRWWKFQGQVSQIGPLLPLVPLVCWGGSLDFLKYLFFFFKWGEGVG